MHTGTDVLSINPSASVRAEAVAGTRHRAVVVDDVYDDPERVAAMAAATRLGRRIMPTDVPGVGAFVEHDAESLAASICEWYGVALPAAEHRSEQVFAIMASDPQTELSPSQRQPHVEPGLTTLVYLNPDNECVGGTALYRHRLTGLDLVPVRPTRDIARIARQLGYPAARLAAPGGYAEFLERSVFSPRSAAPPGELINDGNAHWEPIHRFAMRFNRMVIYDGRIPHSAFCPPARYRGMRRMYQLLSIPIEFP